jgi:hypothetical protein
MNAVGPTVTRAVLIISLTAIIGCDSPEIPWDATKAPMETNMVRRP